MDNGIPQWEDGEPRYALTTTLSARVARLNPTWNQPNQDTEVRAQEARVRTAEDKARKVGLSKSCEVKFRLVPKMSVVSLSFPGRVQASDGSGAGGVSTETKFLPA